MSPRKLFPVRRSVISARSRQAAFTHSACGWTGKLVVMTDVSAKGSQSVSECIPDRALVPHLRPVTTHVTPPQHTSSSTADLKSILEYIEDNIATSIPLQDLVRMFGMSQSALCVAFKRTTGMPPHRYQLSARIRRAQAQMLAQPDRPLSELAKQLGFADQAHFGRVFRRFAGESPAMWLRNRRGREKEY